MCDTSNREQPALHEEDDLPKKKSRKSLGEDLLETLDIVVKLLQSVTDQLSLATGKPNSGIHTIFFESLQSFEFALSFYVTGLSALENQITRVETMDWWLSVTKCKVNEFHPVKSGFLSVCVCELNLFRQTGGPVTG